MGERQGGTSPDDKESDMRTITRIIAIATLLGLVAGGGVAIKRFRAA